MKQFRIKYFWEFVQNLPLVVGLLLAIQAWQKGLPFTSIVVMILGSILGALLIRFTEQFIVPEDQAGLVGNMEPISVTLTNVVLMFIFMLVLTAYLTAVWSSLWTDLPVGSLIGVILSASQSKAARQPVSLRHSAAFAAAFPLALITLRLFSEALPLLISSLLITVIVTLTITYIDYGYSTSVEEGTN